MRTVTLKKRKSLALILCVILLAVALFSIIYIIHEEHHDCSHENCPICINIHQCESNIRLIGSWAMALSCVFICILQIAKPLLIEGKLFQTQTLISKKVRLNN